MYNENKKFTRLTFENSDNKFIWESPYEDIGLDEIIHAFFSQLIGMTWHPNTIYDNLAAYLHEHASDLYDIYEHQEEPLEEEYYEEEYHEESCN